MSKTCIICNKKIIEKKDRWVRLTDFHKKAQVGEVFYHLECWRDRFKISNSARKQEMYKQAQKSIGKIIQAVNPGFSNNNQTFDIR